jgi:hypothetical protein
MRWQDSCPLIERVLKPRGKFFFREHGLSDKPTVRIWQHRLTPLQKMWAGGCHLNQNIQALVEHQFGQIEVTPVNLPGLTFHLYQGVASKK